MSTFNIIENTISNSFSGKDILLAGGLLGSFVYLSLSVPEKVMVVRPKEKHSHTKSKGIFCLFLLIPYFFLIKDQTPKSTGHKKNRSYYRKADHIATEPSDMNLMSPGVNSSLTLQTEGADEQFLPETSHFYKTHQENHSKSHMQIPKHKVSFNLQDISPDNISQSQSFSPNPLKKNVSWLNENQKSETSEPLNGETNIVSSFILEPSPTKKTTEKNKKTQSTEKSPLRKEILEPDNIKETEEKIKKLQSPEKSSIEKKGFRGLNGFKSAMAMKNPYFLSGMGFSALALKGSGSMFRASSVKSSIKFSKSLKDLNINAPKTLYHLPVEKPLLSKDDLAFIEKMLKEREEEQVKILDSNNRSENVKRKTLDVNVEGQDWEITEYNTKDFNLDNVYKNFLIEQKPTILLPLKNEEEDLQSPKKNLDSVLEMNEKYGDNSAIFRKKTHHLKIPLTMKNTPNKRHIFPDQNEEVAEFLSNSFYEKTGDYVKENQEDEMLRLNEIIKNCRKFEDIEEQNLGTLSQETNESLKLKKNFTNISEIVENVRLNVCIKMSQDSEKESFAIGKLTFTVNQSGIFRLGNEPLPIDFSGKRLVQLIMNHQTKKDIFEGVWHDDKLWIPPESIALGENTLTFLTGTDANLVKTPFTMNDLSMILPYFNDLDKPIDLHLTWLYPKKLKMISCLPELYNQKMSDFEIDSHLNLNDFLLSKIRSRQGLKSHGFIFGDFEEILVNDAFNFYCRLGSKKNYIKKTMGLSDVLRLAEAFFNSYFKSLDPMKSNLKFVFIDQKVPVRVFHGMILLKSSYMTREDKFPQLFFFLLKLLLKEIFIENRVNFKPEHSWIFHGLAGFTILHFLEKPISSSFELPIKEVRLFLIRGKGAALQQNLLKSGTHTLNDNSLDCQQREDPIQVNKSIYFFKQLAAYISKKSIHDVLMELDYKNFSLKMFMERLEPLLRENEIVYFKKWLGVWLCGLGVQEIEFEIYSNPKRPLFLNELLILQRPVNWSQGFNELNYHFLAFCLVNNAGISQYTLDIVIPNTSESCIIDKVKGKYVPKALVLDPDDNGYFLYIFDQKTKGFLLNNITKLTEGKMRANCYISFYLETILGRFNVLDFFEMALRGLESENQFVLLKTLSKYCKGIYRVLGFDECRVRLFKFFISAIGSKKFIGNEEFLFSNAIFYCKLAEEFKLLEKTFEKIEISHGILQYVSLLAKFLWKKTFFDQFKEPLLLSSNDSLDKNNIYLEKILQESELDVKKQMKDLFNNMIEFMNSGIEKLFEKVLELFSSNLLINDTIVFESLHLGAQILEEFELSFKIEKNENNDEYLDQNKLLEFVHYSEENEAWEIVKPLFNLIPKEKWLESCKEKRILRRLIEQRIEIEERLKYSLNFQRILL